MYGERDLTELFAIERETPAIEPRSARQQPVGREAAPALIGDAWANACRVCAQPITFGELCPICAKGNDPFFTTDNAGADLKP